MKIQENFDVVFPKIKSNIGIQTNIGDQMNWRVFGLVGTGMAAFYFWERIFAFVEAAIAFNVVFFVFASIGLVLAYLTLLGFFAIQMYVIIPGIILCFRPGGRLLGISVLIGVAIFMHVIGSSIFAPFWMDWMLIKLPFQFAHDMHYCIGVPNVDPSCYWMPGQT